MAATWNRKTPWRQGHALTLDSAVALGIVSPKQETLVPIVISHDCDLAQDPEKEPIVELVMGTQIESPNGNFTHAKNARRLHLGCTSGGRVAYLDLIARQKVLIDKIALAEYAPNTNLIVAPEDRSVLQVWLAARYRRSAFPDEFERRLQQMKLDERIAKIVEPLGMFLVAVFFDVDNGEDIERNGPGDLYRLNIDFLYSTEEDPMAALEAVQKAANSLSDEFRERCLIPGKGWQWIELAHCEPIADDVMTYIESRQLKHWHMDYLSLRAQIRRPKSSPNSNQKQNVWRPALIDFVPGQQSGSVSRVRVRVAEPPAVATRWRAARVF